MLVVLKHPIILAEPKLFMQSIHFIIISIIYAITVYVMISRICNT